jgi:hypothetical protein
MAESQNVLRARHRIEPPVPAGVGGTETVAGDVELKAAFSFWLLPFGFCLLAFAFWLLPFGFCLLAFAF